MHYSFGLQISNWIILINYVALQISMIFNLKHAVYMLYIRFLECY